MSIPDLEKRRKKLLYRAEHRGFKEADFVFGGFARENLANMAEAELNEFEALLTFPDHDLYGWIMGGKEPPDDAKGPMFDRLKAFELDGDLPS